MLGLNAVSRVSVLAVASLVAAGCQPVKPEPPRGATPVSSVPISTSQTMPTQARAAADLDETGPISEGLTSWRGMVVPTKGGFQIRGVTVDQTDFTRRLFASSIDGVPTDPDWYLGAIVRVRGVVVRHEDEPIAEEDAKLHVQRRAGSWLEANRLETVELVKAAETVEGTLHRSKGFFSVDKVLVSRDDVAWALRGAQDGDKVKLWGQLHVQVCHPQAQCLLGGSLPIFQVGRGSKLP